MLTLDRAELSMYEKQILQMQGYPSSAMDALTTGNYHQIGGTY